MYYIFLILSIFGLLICSGLGALTLFRNPRHPANIGFTLGLSCLALTEAGGALMILSSASDTGLYGYGVAAFFTGLSCLPPAWLFFSAVFARINHGEMLKRWAPAIAAFSAISIFFAVMAASGSPGFIAPQNAPGEAALRFGKAGRYFFIYLILGLVICLVHLENTLRSSAGTKRWRIKYVIFGVGSILAYFIYLSSQALLFSSMSGVAIPLTSAVIVISAGMMALFIAKHRLLDVDIFVSRYVVYNSLTVLAAGLYLIAVGVIAEGIRYFNAPLNYFLASIFVFASILALIIFFFTESLRRKAKLFINRHFYKHKYEFRDKWMDTIERIGSKGTVAEIEATLMEMIAEEMCARPVFIWLYDPASKAYSTEQEVPAGGFKRVPETHALIARLKGDPAPFMKAPETAPGVIEAFEATGTVLCAPLAAGPEVTGFIMIGPDISGEPYIQDDFELLKAVTAQAAVQINNIRLARQIAASREVEAFSKMSSFIMHDLKNLTNSLSLISQNARHNMDNPEFQQDAIKTIDATVSRMKRVIERLSNVPREFDFRKEATEASALIHRVINRVSLKQGKQIAISNELDDALPPIYIDPEAIEMVIFNLITNAYDAIPDKGMIRVRAWTGDGGVIISVSDNGAGMTFEYIRDSLFQPFKTTKKNGLGIGLFQCKAIIEAHGGTISVESEPGKGTDFRIRLPFGLDSVKDQPYKRA